MHESDLQVVVGLESFWQPYLDMSQNHGLQYWFNYGQEGKDMAEPQVNI